MRGTRWTLQWDFWRLSFAQLPVSSAQWSARFRFSRPGRVFFHPSDLLRLHRGFCQFRPEIFEWPEVLTDLVHVCRCDCNQTFCVDASRSQLTQSSRETDHFQKAYSVTLKNVVRRFAPNGHLACRDEKVQSTILNMSQLGPLWSGSGKRSITDRLKNERYQRSGIGHIY